MRLSVRTNASLYNARAVFVEVWCVRVDHGVAVHKSEPHTVGIAHDGHTSFCVRSTCGPNDRGDAYAVAVAPTHHTNTRDVPFALVSINGSDECSVPTMCLCDASTTSATVLCVDVLSEEFSSPEAHDRALAGDVRAHDIVVRRRASCTLELVPSSSTVTKSNEFDFDLVAYGDLSMREQHFERDVPIDRTAYVRGTVTVTVAAGLVGARAWSAPPELEALTRAYAKRYVVWCDAQKQWSPLARVVKYDPKWFAVRNSFFVHGAAMVRESARGTRAFRADDEWVVRQFEVAAFCMNVDLPRALDQNNETHRRLFARACRVYAERHKYARDYRMVAPGSRGYDLTDVTTRLQNQEAADCEDMALFGYEVALFLRSYESAQNKFAESVRAVALRFVPFVVYGAVTPQNASSAFKNVASDVATETSNNTKGLAHAFCVLVPVAQCARMLGLGSATTTDEVLLVETVAFEEARCGVAELRASDVDLHSQLSDAISSAGLASHLAVMHRESYAHARVGGVDVEPFRLHAVAGMFVSSVPSALFGLDEGALVFLGTRASDGAPGAPMSEVLDGTAKLVPTPAMPHEYVRALDAVLATERPLSHMKTSETKRAAKLDIARRLFSSPTPKCAHASCDVTNVFVHVDEWVCEGRYPAYETTDARVRECASAIERVLCAVNRPSTVRALSADAQGWVCARVCFAC